MIKIIETEQYGRGVYATIDIPSGVNVELAELLILSKEDTTKVNETDLQYYTFKFTDDQDCLVLGVGEIFNHSDSPNVSYSIIEHENRPKMQFVTIRDVKAGEQLFTDYNQDVKVETKNYNKNLI
jgi:SET domain-containing protein